MVPREEDFVEYREPIVREKGVDYLWEVFPWVSPFAYNCPYTPLQCAYNISY